MRTTLHDVERGEAFRIDAVADDEVRAQLHRMGFLDGTVECRHRVVGGPVVITRRGTDLAVGATVADDVEISPRDQRR
ncbi:MAG: FeoA family protein [Halanaeroarchaeum sp.]